MPSARSGPAATPPSVSSHSTLVAEKYGSSTRPVVARTSGSWPAVAELVAAGGGAAVLPHDGAVQGPAGAAVPGHDRLALVGDADGGDRLGRARPASSARVACTACPDLGGVVLHPAGPGEVLGELPVDEAGRGAVVAQRDGPHPGGAGIDGDHDGHRARHVTDNVGHERTRPLRRYRCASRCSPAGATAPASTPSCGRSPARASASYGDELVGFLDGWKGVLEGRTMPLGVEHAPRHPAPGRHDPRLVADQPVQGRRRARAGAGHAGRASGSTRSSPSAARTPSAWPTSWPSEGVPVVGRAQDDRQRPVGHRAHLRLRHRRADLRRRHRPAPHHRREPRPGDGGRGDGPPRRPHRRVGRASPAAPR